MYTLYTGRANARCRTLAWAPVPTTQRRAPGRPAVESCVCASSGLPLGFRGFDSGRFGIQRDGIPRSIEGASQKV